MWVDERGSDVLGPAECHQLLAIGARRHLPGHLGIPDLDAPTVLPVDYLVDGHDVLIRVGESLFARVEGKLVAFEVEAPDDDRPWSVLVKGLALPEAFEAVPGKVPVPRAARPGHRLVRIRSDAVTGRRLGQRPAVPW
ncbi:MAG TPA: pyridoxamine 5'-phosphate oxidase family protein [Acidimicrobiales bacterium]